MSKVCVFLADGFEEIEGLTVVDLLRRANIETHMVSIMKRKEVTGSHNITVIADKLYEDSEFSDYDIIVLPGGMPGTLNLSKHEELIELIKNFHVTGKDIAAICAAPSILGDNGILEGKRAVCYPGYESRLTGATVTEEKVEVEAHIITSRGMGTANDFGLAIIEKLINQETALNIKNSICYNN
jgi:4-methyl-5(b-hydroxyethyl)-thiazole monophosphate biosynthesis